MLPCQDTPSVKHTYYAQVLHSNYRKLAVLNVHCYFAILFSHRPEVMVYETSLEEEEL